MPICRKTFRLFKPSSRHNFFARQFFVSIMALSLLLLAFGCAKPVPIEETLVALEPRPAQGGVTPDGLLLTDGLAERLLVTAYSQVGTPYRYGGTSPTKGFDCSGFTRWVYSQNGIQLPRSSKEQFQVGRAVEVSELKPGDLLMFKWGRRGSGTHIGIYVGDGMYIHSPSRGKAVMENEAFSSKSNLHFMGARRVFEDPSSCPLTPEQKLQAKKNYTAAEKADIKIVLKPGEEPVLVSNLTRPDQQDREKAGNKNKPVKHNPSSAKKKS